MSERNNIIEINTKTKDEQKNNLGNSQTPSLIIDDKDDENKYGFGISAHKLEQLMGFYKDRGDDYKDLLFFQKLGGVSNLLDSLLTNESTGISSIEGREEMFGSNKVFKEPVSPFCAYVWEALEDMMVRILIVCAIVQIVLGCTLSDDPSKDWIDGVSIIVAILVVVLVGSITNYQKETKFHELNEVQSEGTKYNIIRKGTPKEYISDDILVGDLIMINYGDIMPVDLLLIEGNGIKMDESALTGESDAMKKEPFHKCIELQEKGETKLPSPLILSGTNCIEGSGKAIVLAVGEHSQKGMIRRTIDNAQEKSKTPLEEKLDKIAGMIGYFGLGAGIVTLVALFIRFGVSFSNQMKDYENDSKIESIMTFFLFNFPYKKNEDNVSGNTNNNLTDPKSMVAKNILDIIILCISIIVVAIPEGLPLAVTLSLAFSIKKLMDYNNLVRKMHACETMGGANYICTDKTGTLTKNEMSVFKVLTGNTEFELQQNIEIENVGDIGNQGTNTQKLIREDHQKYFKNEYYWEVLKLAISLNVECSIEKYNHKDLNGDTEKCESKNKTDKAFIDFLYRFKSPISLEKEKYLKNQLLYKQFPFDSKRKRMTTFVKNEDFPSKYRLFSKGGGENSTIYCKSYLDPENGTIKPMDDKNEQRIKDSIKNFNKEKLRSLYIAFKDITKEEYTNCEKVNDDGKLIDQYGLVFLGVFGIRDSLRDGVIEAVRKCHEASVNVVMVTGDNVVTATAIAKECGILGNDVNLKDLGPDKIEQNPEAMNDNSRKKDYIRELLKNKPRALTGNSFYNCIEGLVCAECKKDTNICKCPKTEAEANELKKKFKEEKPRPIKRDVIKNKANFKIITERLNVMARSQPIHKYALVLGLKELNNVVAVTGDGTNDAPALSKSDVGFAMFAGTDIAKEASDIVIIDNNFSSIVTAIIYGRNIYDNIRKFLQFQLSVNFCACLLVFICACIGNETPLTPIQMLWVNLIMDSLGSLALATEPPYNELLQRKPAKRSESIINARMWKHIILQSLCQIIILIILYLIAPEFVKEGDLERLAENTIIHYCYGTLPGNSNKVGNIIYGTESKWSSDDKLKTSINKEYCGDYASRQSLSVAYKEYSNANGGTVHMTIIFNVFVIYTLFNQINCRIIDDSFNIFKRIGRSCLFPLITLVEMALQVLIVLFGKSIFHVANNALTGEQWGICFGFSAITFVVCIIGKLLPIDKIIDYCLFKDEKIEVIKPIKPDIISNSTHDSSNNIRLHTKKKYYDQILPVEEKRNKEDRDYLRLSENSSVQIPKEKDDL